MKPASPKVVPGVWVVLGGGGVKGMAHIGAWRAMAEAGVEAEGIVGTSIGALVGACIAGGMSLEEMDAQAREVEKERIVRIRRRAAWINGIKETSLYDGEVFREYLDSVLPVDRWSALRLPLQVNALNLASGELDWFGTGANTEVTLLDAVLASASLPVLYPPVEVGGAFWVDGGAGDALAVDRAEALGATKIIAVDVGSAAAGDGRETVERGMVAIHQRVFSIMEGRRRREVVERWSGVPLVYIRPDVGHYSSFDFSAIDYFIEEGYRATRRALASSAVIG